MRINSVIPLSLSMLIAGCSIHPLPKDVSRHSTYDIVKNMRCEAKYQVLEAIRKLLQHPSNSDKIANIHPKAILDKENMKLIINEYNKHKFIIREYAERNNIPKWKERRKLEELPDIELIIRAFIVMAITYEFDFEITENNDARGNAAFRLPFVGGIANFGTGATLGGSLTKTRTGKRTFTMGESFGELRELKCGEEEDYYLPANNYLQVNEEHVSLRKKFIFPLTGSIGMDKIMEEFLRLSLLGGGEGSFSDVITFTTVAAAGITAEVDLNQGPLKKFRLLRAMAAASASRTDVHQVTVSLAWPNMENKFALQHDNDLAARTVRRAAIEQCVQHGESREDRSVPGIRNMAPEQYCPDYVDALLKNKGKEEEGKPKKTARAPVSTKVVPRNFNKTRKFEIQGQTGGAKGKAGASQGKTGESPGKAGASQGKTGESPGKAGGAKGKAGGAKGKAGGAKGKAGGNRKEPDKEKKIPEGGQKKRKKNVQLLEYDRNAVR